MSRFMQRTCLLVGGLVLSALSIRAAEIALSGTDPTQILTTNPPVFSFTVDNNGFFSSEYLNESGFTFLNLLITGAADGISSVGCSPDSIFTSCSASINTVTDLVSFTFSGGPGIANNQAFFLVATDFVPGQTLTGTSTMTSPNSFGPEPATVFLMMGAFGIMALAVATREFLKLRSGT
jgi:hypothetical protein